MHTLHFTGMKKGVNTINNIKYYIEAEKRLCSINMKYLQTVLGFVSKIYLIFLQTQY